MNPEELEATGQPNDPGSVFRERNYAWFLTELMACLQW
jgi:hypothetical protein